MQRTLKYKNMFLTSKSGDLFLTVDSLITLNDIITGSQYIGLKDINVKPAGYSKIYLGKSFAEAALHCLVDQFNDRIVSHKDFCRIFLDQINPFRAGNCKRYKIWFVDQIKKIYEQVDFR